MAVTPRWGERIIIGGANDASAVVEPKNATPASDDWAIPVRTIDGAAGIADGADVAEGATTDAAITSDANGTVSGKLRGLVKILAAVWDSVNNVLNMNIARYGGTATTLGQKTKAASIPITLASDQGSLGVSIAQTLSVLQPDVSSQFTLAVANTSTTIASALGAKGVVGIHISASTVSAGSLTFSLLDQGGFISSSNFLASIWYVEGQAFAANPIAFAGLDASHNYIVFTSGGDKLVATTSSDWVGSITITQNSSAKTPPAYKVTGTVAATISNLGQTTMASSVPVTIASDQSTLNVKEPKDTSRTYVTLYAQLITGVTSEALATFTKNVNGTATTGQTAYTITNGKTFVIESLSMQVLNTTTVINRGLINVRVAASVSASSPIVASLFASAPAALAEAAATGNQSYPNGIFLAGDGSIQIGISHLESVTTASITSFILTGYEF